MLLSVRCRCCCWSLLLITIPRSINVTMRVLNLPAPATNMLSKIFKKNDTPPSPTPAPKPPAAPTPAQIAAQAADKTAWESKLEAALGDDAALLAIAKESPLIDIKHAAVDALTGEDALKRAEREFRDHDRRVHRTAKQRYESLVNRRVAGLSKRGWRASRQPRRSVWKWL